MTNFPEKPEIFIGLVGAVGTDLDAVCHVLDSLLKNFGYSTSLIRLSELISDVEHFKAVTSLNDSAEGERINGYMNAGDALREKAGRADILSILSVLKIRQIRKTFNENKGASDNDKPIPARAYILKSLKHPSEIKSLKNTYGKSFLALSVYSPRSERLANLADLLASSSYQGSNSVGYRADAEKLIEKDAKSGVEEYGQNISQAFPESDVFINMGDKEFLSSELGRVLEIWFQHPFRTPNIDESGMFHAAAAALRSCDLSRQVGAVVTSSRGEILTTGCNEVPKAGGGLFWHDDQNDDRDFRLGYDSTAKMKEQMVGEILERLKSNNWLSREKQSSGLQDLLDSILYGNEKKVLKGTRVASIIEFGRIVHAEMAAITEAARRGISLEGATLYCTTYPCHMCARHIIAAGLKRVVFIEPYPKSMTKELYGKSISNERDTHDGEYVSFEPFVGIAPKRYVEFFSMKPRKNERGVALDWNMLDASPSVERIGFYLEAEEALGRWVSDSDNMNVLFSSRGNRWKAPKEIGYE